MLHGRHDRKIERGSGERYRCRFYAIGINSANIWRGRPWFIKPAAP